MVIIYWDYGYLDPIIDLKFTDNIERVVKFIENIKVKGCDKGEMDECEDVLGGLREILKAKFVN